MSKVNQPPRTRPIGRGPMGVGTGEKAKDFKGTITKLIKIIKPFRTTIAIVMFFAVLSTFFSIFSPKVLGKITDEIAQGYIERQVYTQLTKSLPEGTTFEEGTKGQVLLDRMPQEAKDQLTAEQIEMISEMDISKTPGVDFNAIAKIAIFLILIYVASATFVYVQGYLMAGVAQKVTYNLRKQISQKLDKLPLSYFDEHSHGDVLSRVTNDVESINHTLGQNLTQMVTSITTIIGIVAMMLSISWVMTFIAILVLPVSMLIISLIVKRSQKHFKKQQSSLADINGHVEEMYSGHLVIKAFNKEEDSVDKFSEINTQLCDSAWKSQFFSGIMMPLMGFVGNLGYVAVCVVGGFLSLGGRVTIGDIQAFIQYVRQFNQPIQQTAQIANMLQSVAAAAERVFEFLDEPEETEDPTLPEKIENFKGVVEFKNVSFGYTPEKTIINNFSCRINPGEKVAIVGPTGAGKTTIVKLLMRFYEINSGSITIDGVDIRNMSRDYLRDMFGMVLQETWLFGGTVKENIRYGRQDATDDDVYLAAKSAHVDHFVHTLPGGYDMELNEEATNVSQGQKQLLTIARCVISQPSIMILDEATSSVDTRTEVLIQKAMNRIMEGRTSFVIAHRLSTIRDADVILVMNNGDIVETGNHDTLIEKGGFYAKLYNSQFEGKEG